MVLSPFFPMRFSKMCMKPGRWRGGQCVSALSLCHIKSVSLGLSLSDQIFLSLPTLPSLVSLYHINSLFLPHTASVSLYLKPRIGPVVFSANHALPRASNELVVVVQSGLSFLFFIWEDLWFGAQKTGQSELSLLPVPFSFFPLLSFICLPPFFSFCLIASACFMCLSCFSILLLFVPVSLFFFNSSVLSSLWSVCVLVWF